MRSLPYRALISVPSAFFGAGTLLSLPWVLLAAFGILVYRVKVTVDNREGILKPGMPVEATFAAQ
jgi:hypothetical protein